MNLVQIYSTPIWETKLPNFEDYRDTFLNSVQKFRDENPESVNKTNIYGYQSPNNLTKIHELAPLYEFVAQTAVKANFDMQFVNCDVYLTAAWVNFNDNRSAISYEHVHQDTYSGVFYLKVPKDSGKLIITNPGINPLWQGTMLADKKNKFNADRLKLEPIEGTIFLWPSYLPHGVEPNNHDEERISICFNVISIPKDPVPHTK
jgi:uncharacterized protein (TIGR02466 family)